MLVADNVSDMPPQQTTRRRVTDEQSGADAGPNPSQSFDDDGSGADDPRTLNSEDVHVRSYAHRETYDLRIDVLDPDGDVALSESYALEPGAVKSEINALPAGAYEVRAILDGDRRETRYCRVDDSPAGTIVIEVGNGVLSLTEGLYY